MRISVRLIVALVVGVTLVALLFDWLRLRTERERQEDDLERRSVVLGESLTMSVVPLLDEGSRTELQQAIDSVGSRDGLAGLAVYGDSGEPLATTSGIPELREAPASVAEVLRSDQPLHLWTTGDRLVHAYTVPLHRAGKTVGAMVLLHDASYIVSRWMDVWRLDFIQYLIQALLIAGLTLFIVQWSITGPVVSTAEWMRRLRAGDASGPARLPRSDVFAPLVQEVMHLTTSLTAARAAAEEEARLREAAESLWTPERLKEHVRGKLRAQSLFVVSNREPYIHVRKGREIRWIVPPSGVVTATEPVLRACGGTWIAFGGGDADRETADDHGRLRVPPDDPRYTLRRVWLSSAEEDGHYYGFSNEGLWPLCHIAHTRPAFETEDWAQYQAVNAKFAEATLEELEGVREPCILVHDYHFALLPRLIKDRRPDAKVAIFWHIPWPNPEAFGICPWQKELLDGLLGADLIGFHTQFHCNNFLETVDRTLESRIDRETFAINRMGHTTSVKPFPISVAYPTGVRNGSSELGRDSLKEALLTKLRVRGPYLGVGVDRLDYTKGLLERFRGLERFFENYPSYRGRLTFVELGAPSRTRISEYRNLAEELEAEVERINRRLREGDWRPLIFLKGHHTHQDIQPFYRAADFCLVTSLHDGMNLVAKEYVAARDADDGVLILSRFTGAARELESALLINPYDLGQISEAIHNALEMDSREVRTRMVGMRRQVKEANVYRWAANLLSELCEMGSGRGQLRTSA